MLHWLTWIVNNPKEVAALGGVAYVVLNVLNGLLPNPKAKSVVRSLLDTVSILTNRDSPGTLKMPIKRSRKPGSMEDAKLPEKVAP